MWLDVGALVFFLSGVVLMLRWIYAAIRVRATVPAPDTSFTLPAMRDRRRRRRGGIYLGAGLLCIGVGLFLSGMAVRI